MKENEVKILSENIDDTTFQGEPRLRVIPKKNGVLRLEVWDIQEHNYADEVAHFDVERKALEKALHGEA